MTERGFKWTSHFWNLPWIALFFGSAIGLMKSLKIVQEGCTVDSVLLHTSAVLCWIALLALVTGFILDAVRKDGSITTQLRPEITSPKTTLNVND